MWVVAGCDGSGVGCPLKWLMVRFAAANCVPVRSVAVRWLDRSAVEL